MEAATIFDFNGVLVDDEEVHLAAFRDALKPLGVDFSDKDYWESYIGFDDVGGFEAMLKDAGRTPSPEEISALVEAKRPLYMQRARQELKTFAGAAELIRRRREFGPVLVVSGALHDEVVFGLEALGVSDCVEKIYAAEATSVSKPDPEGYLLAIEYLRNKIGDAAENAIVIEDSVAGVQAAKAAGLFCLTVGHSYGQKELNAAGADVFVGTLKELTDDHFLQAGA